MKKIRFIIVHAIRAFALENKIQKTSKIFQDRINEIHNLDLVGDIRHKGMVMGIELVKNKKSKKHLPPGKPITLTQEKKSFCSLDI